MSDASKCPETCPHIMQCVIDQLVELARADWQLADTSEGDGNADAREGL